MQKLAQDGIAAAAIHSDKRQAGRARVLGFKANRVRIPIEITYHYFVKS